MDKEALKDIGLSDNEAEVYMLLLQMQEALASEIAEKSKISRPHIYDTIAKLIDKGLASYVVKNNRRYFRPANPEIFVEILKGKEESLRNNLPEMKKMYEPRTKKPVVEVYEGKEGLKTILKDLIRVKKEMCSFGPTTKWEAEIPIALEQYFRDRKKIGFKARLLAPEGSQVLNYPLNEYKFISQQFSSPASTMIYGDKTCFVLWLDPTIAVLIENKDLAESFRSYFELMWNAQAKTFTGKEGAKAFLDDILITKPKEYFVFGGSGNIAQIMPEYRYKWDKKRIAAGIKVRRIYNDTAEGRKEAERYSEFELREHKFMPVEDTPIITMTYEDRVWFASWNIKEPIFVLIENREIAKGFQNQFLQLWNQTQFVYMGVEGLKKAMMKIVDDKPKELFVFGSSGASIKIMPETIAEWHRKRIRYKIKTKIVYTDSPETRERLKKLKKDIYYDIRLMPANYPSPVATFIYEDNVAIMALMEGGFATFIKKKEIAEIYKKQFEMLWKISKKY